MKLELLSCKGIGDAADHRPPLLFIHGSFCAAWIWSEHFMPWFAKAGWDCFAVSLRGHGGSEGNVAEAGLHDYLEDCGSALAELERSPVVIGHSMGGLVAQWLPARHPVAGLVLTAAVPPSGLVSSALHMSQRSPDVLWQLGIMQTLGPDHVDGRVIHRALFGPDTPLSIGLPYLPRMQRESGRISLDMMSGRWPPRPDPLPPTLVVGGDRDAFLPVSAFRETAAFWAGELVVMDGAPHALMLEPCWERVAETVGDWLKSEFPYSRALTASMRS